MRTVHSLLAIYGALDQMVTEGNSEAAAIIERYLPGTTGANAGWFDEIRNFLDIPEGDLPEFGTITDSINILEEEHNAFLESDDEKPLTKSQQSRLAFVLGVLSRLPNMEPRLTDEDLVRGLMLAVPAGISNREEVAHQLLGVLRENFTHRDDWPAVMTLAKGLIDPTVARVPLCRTRLRRAHGHNSVVLTTEFTIPTPSSEDSSDDVPSLDDLKSVVDPLNWHNCLPFFCDMQELKLPKRQDGWSRVLEITSTTCGVYGTPVMKTPLKYWKGPRKEETSLGTPPFAWVNYELDDTPVTPFPGDGLVLVDEGFIKMYSTNINSGAPGVRVVTKKVVCFRYLSEVAIAILACVSGYGDQGMDMLLEGVEKRNDPDNQKDWTDWEPSEPLTSGSTTTSPTAPTEPTDISVPSDPTRPSRRAIILAVDMATECIDEFSKKSTALASKMTTGAMPVPEMITLSTELAARLATDPWRYLERLREQQRGDK